METNQLRFILEEMRFSAALPAEPCSSRSRKNLRYRVLRRISFCFAKGRRITNLYLVRTRSFGTGNAGAGTRGGSYPDGRPRRDGRLVGVVGSGKNDDQRDGHRRYGSGCRTRGPDFKELCEIESRVWLSPDASDGGCTFETTGRHPTATS